MKTVGIEQVTLDHCVEEAQHEQVIVTRNGAPVALIVRVEGMDEEQVRLGASGQFWRLLSERRGQRSMSRAELEQRFSDEG